jgi:hypothetical protein
VTVREAINQEVLAGANGEDVVSEEVGRVSVGGVVEFVECNGEGKTTIGLLSNLPDDSVPVTVSISAVSAATGDRCVDVNRPGPELQAEPESQSQIKSQEQKERKQKRYPQPTPPPLHEYPSSTFFPLFDPSHQPKHTFMSSHPSIRLPYPMQTHDEKEVRGS